MAFTNNFLCTSFKQQILEAVHDFRTAGDTFKLALYDNNASFTAATTAYTASNEVGDSGSYSAGGGVDPTTSSTTAFTDFADLSFTSATITAFGALIYNSTPTHTYTNPTVCVLDFSGAKTSTNGTFTIIFPTDNSTSAIIRIA